MLKPTGKQIKLALMEKIYDLLKKEFNVKEEHFKQETMPDSKGGNGKGDLMPGVGFTKLDISGNEIFVEVERGDIEFGFYIKSKFEAG